MLKLAYVEIFCDGAQKVAYPINLFMITGPRSRGFLDGITSLKLLQRSIVSFETDILQFWEYGRFDPCIGSFCAKASLPWLCGSGPVQWPDKTVDWKPIFENA